MSRFLITCILSAFLVAMGNGCLLAANEQVTFNAPVLKVNNVEGDAYEPGDELDIHWTVTFSSTVNRIFAWKITMYDDNWNVLDVQPGSVGPGTNIVTSAACDCTGPSRPNQTVYCVIEGFYVDGLGQTHSLDSDSTHFFVGD